MRRDTVIRHRASWRTDSWWYLTQDDDGTLYVERVDDTGPDTGITRWTLNEFIRAAGKANQALQDLIDRMFE